MAGTVPEMFLCPMCRTCKCSHWHTSCAKSVQQPAAAAAGVELLCTDGLWPRRKHRGSPETAARAGWSAQGERASAAGTCLWLHAQEADTKSQVILLMQRSSFRLAMLRSSLPAPSLALHAFT